MVRKYPNIDRVVGGYGRLKYYLTHPYQIEKQYEQQYEGIYHKTIGYLLKMYEGKPQDLIYFFQDVKGISTMIYDMFGFTRLTHYILYKFNQERIEYYRKNNIELPDLDSIF
jgi:hypothetical protein